MVTDYKTWKLGAIRMHWYITFKHKKTMMNNCIKEENFRIFHNFYKDKNIWTQACFFNWDMGKFRLDPRSNFKRILRQRNLNSTTDNV